MGYMIPFFILFISIVYFYKYFKQKDQLANIPGPKQKPIFGNLLDLKDGNLHLKFQEWYYQYGPIFKIKMGRVNTIVLTEYSTIKEAFLVHSSIFMPRFQRLSRKQTSNWESLINGNGDLQKHLKTIMMSELTSSKLKKMECNIKDEAKRLCALLDKQAESGEAFNINNYIKMFAMNIVLRFVFGVSFPYGHLEDSIGLISVVNDYFEAAALPIVSDFIPLLSPLSRKVNSKFKAAYDHLHQHVIEQVEIYKKRKLIDSQASNSTTGGGGGGDSDGEESSTILDKLLKDYESGVISENSFVGTLIDLLAAGVDTSANTITFAIIELINNQDYQDKLYHALKDSISDSDFTSEEGISYNKYKSSIPYLSNIMKETFRKYPAGLLGLPHITSEDVEISGYKIPQGTQVIQNIYSTHRNKNVWYDPDRFDPSRFDNINSNPQVLNDSNGTQLIQFGLGRRSCPGAVLAESEIFTCLATLFKKFKFINPSSSKLSENGKFGVSYISPSTNVIVQRRALY